MNKKKKLVRIRHRKNKARLRQKLQALMPKVAPPVPEPTENGEAVVEKAPKKKAAPKKTAAKKTTAKKKTAAKKTTAKKKPAKKKASKAKE